MKFLKTYTQALVLLLLLISTEAFAQQNGTNNGKVTTADGQGVVGVTVSLKHAKYSALTNTNDEYTISKARAASYQVVSSYIELGTQEQAAIVKTSEVTTVNFVLKESSSQLNEVIVSSSKNNRPTNTVAKMPLKNLSVSLSHETKYFRVAYHANNITNQQYFIGYWSVNPQKQEILSQALLLNLKK
ncbi:carboxypeptidase-like regulatory domain-containing protein [Pedobacter sp. ASV28]|uniref:carboxypeptidase-like regulatory domain-containing protein n=1 Tax=Pedobacter sp. ASV28 TaxID=2795123 RepID=UPI0018EAFCE6|nr:carboxypeptidase-like regulatory domain-containing protein [Pedobacter sp. ASV28]